MRTAMPGATGMMLWIVLVGVLAGQVVAQGMGSPGEPAMVPLPANPSTAPASSDLRLAQLEAEVAALKGEQSQAPAPASVVSPGGLFCPSPGWYAGASATFAKPVFSDGAVARVASRPHANTIRFEVRPFDYDFEVTPRVWIGFTDEDGLGMRARGWHFDHDGAAFAFQSDGSSAAMVSFALNSLPIEVSDPGDTLTVTDSLKMTVVDAEITQQVRFQLARLQLGAGLRSAGIESDVCATAVIQGDPVSGLCHYDFDGIGPTVSAELWRPLGSCGLALFVNTRGSILLGRADNLVDLCNGVVHQQIILAGDDDEKVVGNGELEIGLEWGREFAQTGRWYVRSSYEAQLWLDEDVMGGTDGGMGIHALNVAFGVDR